MPRLTIYTEGDAEFAAFARNFLGRLMPSFQIDSQPGRWEDNQELVRDMLITLFNAYSEQGIEQETTLVGEDVTDQIASGESCYGNEDGITLGDARQILDAIHTNMAERGVPNRLVGLLYDLITW